MKHIRTKNLLITGIILFILSSTTSAVELEVVTEEWRPYNYLENNEVKGISTEIVKKVLDRADIKYSIKIYPWSRSYMMAQLKPDVLIYTIIRIPARETGFKWIRPLGKDGLTSLYRLKKNTHINPKTIKEARQYSIVVNKDSMDHLWLKHEGFTKLELPPKVENSINMFFHGRADMIAFDQAVMKEEFSKLGYNVNEVVRIMPLFKTPPYMALSLSTSDTILKKLQTAYDQLLKEKKIKP